MSFAKTASNRNELDKGDVYVNGAIIPRVGGVFDIGTPTQRFKTIYADIEGNVSDPDISINNLRYPYVGPFDLRLYRSGAKTLTLDDNANGAATLTVNGAVNSTTATVNSIANGTNILDLLGSLLTLTPGATQAILRGRLTADTEFRLLLDLTNGLQLGPGGATVPDVRLRRTATGTLTLDNNAGTAGTLNTGTVTSSGALTLSTGISGSLTLGSTGGNVVLNAPSGNVQINRPITTSAGDLTINPAGTNVAFSSKNLTGVANVNMGTNLSTIGLPKIRLYDDGSLRYGIGVQGGSLSYETPNVADAHIFYSGGTERFRANNGALSTSVPISTPSGDLSLTAAGSNINCNSKALTGVGSVTIPTSTSTDVILFSATAVNTGTASGPRINLGGSFSNAGDEPATLKLLIAGGYGFGVGGASLNAIAPSFGGHRWYCTDTAGTTPLLALNTTNGIVIGSGRQLTTSAGDLSLNPVGTNINCNGKTLINAPSQTAASTNYSSTNFSGTLAIRPFREGSLITLEFIGAVTATAVVNTWTATVALPGGFFNGARAYQQLAINQTGTMSTCRIIINGTGIVSISKVPISNFAISEVLDLSNQCITFVAV